MTTRIFTIILLLALAVSGCAVTLHHPGTGAVVECRGSSDLASNFIPGWNTASNWVFLGMATIDHAANIAAIERCVAKAEAEGFVRDSAPPSEKTQEQREGG